MQCQEKQINAKKVPRWFVKFISRQTANNPKTQKILLAILEPMTPQEWCLIWMPIIHPGVELPQEGERNPCGYMESLFGNFVSINRLPRAYCGRVVLWKALPLFGGNSAALFPFDFYIAAIFRIIRVEFIN